MAEPFISEIRIFSFGFPPRGWAFCNGQLLPINQNQALFSLLGTTFGGNGQTNFSLPNLQGKTPIHFGNGFTLGETGGEQAHTLNIQEIPAHSHTLNATNASTANTNLPANNFLSKSAPAEIYASVGNNFQALHPSAVTNIGGSQAHINMQPFITLNFCIALQGLFPSQT
jgi:microcystin-dependent protein